MIQVVGIVEGHGEVEAVPILLRRLAIDWDSTVAFRTPLPIRIHRNKLVKFGELERAVELAIDKADGGEMGDVKWVTRPLAPSIQWILISPGECPGHAVSLIPFSQCFTEYIVEIK